MSDTDFESLYVIEDSVFVRYNRNGIEYDIVANIKDNYVAMTDCTVNYGDNNIEEWRVHDLLFTKSAPPSIPDELKIFVLEELHETYKDMKWCAIDHVEHRINSLQYLKENK